MITQRIIFLSDLHHFEESFEDLLNYNTSLRVSNTSHTC
uniref:Uncharacterized protein n=1 Tax=Cucumis melo TaxID=3656 RepID=A0A9I9CL70_CUCME